MGRIYRTISIFFLSFFSFHARLVAQPSLKPYNVIWNAQSENSDGSMPIGNGDIGSNVWVEKNGTLNLLLSKTDAYSEIGRLLKIGKLEINFSPNILASKDFTQLLDIEKGIIKIIATSGNKFIKLRCWADANNPIVHVEGNSNFPVKVNIHNAMWRINPRPLIGNERHAGYGVAFRDEPFMTEVDTAWGNKYGLMWCHENKSSIWQMTLDNQNISGFSKEAKDPLSQQIFGALLHAKDFDVSDKMNMQSRKEMNKFSMEILIHRSKCKNISEWEKNTVNLHLKRQDHFSTQLDKHVLWWKKFWNRHYLIVDSENEKDKTFEITQAYMLQRYMNACSGRGKMPIKFNGSIFTVNVNEDTGPAKKGYDADYRSWGGNYWFQNTRLIYWTMFMAGDFDLMRPFFNMYIDALPLASYRTKKYFNHNGAYFPETITPWGSYLIDNYGWNRTGKIDGVSDNLYIRYYFQSGLEMCMMMNEYFNYSSDTNYYKTKMIPFIKEIIRFYDQHYKRDANGKLLIEPAQSLETYQEGVLNPTPEIAGLTQILKGILQYQHFFDDLTFIGQCKKLQSELPPLPISEKSSKKVILAGSNLGEIKNIENPELYTIFPYQMFGMGLPDIEIAQNTFAERKVKNTGGWHQDAIQAALIGETAEAKKMVSFNFTNKNPSSRFPVFWGPNYDWIPDQDHGSVAARAIQNMLVQHTYDNILLFPAWPKEWNVKFKFHLPNKELLEGSYDAKQGVSFKQKPVHLTMKILLK